MKLYFLRHGIAAPHGAPGISDDDRPLTPEGRRKLIKIARGMKKLGLSFDVILTSPLPRAEKTARIIAEGLKLTKKLKMEPTLSSHGEPQYFINVLKRQYGRKGAVLAVGHEPYLSELISVLLTGKTDVPLILKKGGLCKLTINKQVFYGRCAELNWLLTQRQLSKLS